MNSINSLFKKIKKIFKHHPSEIKPNYPNSATFVQIEEERKTLASSLTRTKLTFESMPVEDKTLSNSIKKSADQSFLITLKSKKRKNLMKNKPLKEALNQKTGFGFHRVWL